MKNKFLFLVIAISVLFAKSQAHNCFFFKKIKKLVFCGRNAYFCSTISFLPCITGLARQEREILKS